MRQSDRAPDTPGKQVYRQHVAVAQGFNDVYFLSMKTYTGISAFQCVYRYQNFVISTSRCAYSVIAWKPEIVMIAKLQVAIWAKS